MRSEIGPKMFAAYALGVVCVFFFQALEHKMLGPKYSAGQCLLNRAFELVQVAEYDGRSNLYTIRRMQVALHGGWSEHQWFLEKDEDAPLLLKWRNVVENNYTLIPCTTGLADDI